jgi:hypothetical protein
MRGSADIYNCIATKFPHHANRKESTRETVRTTDFEVALGRGASSCTAVWLSVLERRVGSGKGKIHVPAQGVKIVHTVRRILTGCAKVVIAGVG